MPEKNIHILITGETGKGKSLIVNKQSLCRWGAGALLTLLFLAVSSFFLLHQQMQKQIIGSEFTELNQQLTDLQTKQSADATDLREELNKTRLALEEERRKRISISEKYDLDVAQLRQEKENLLEDSISELDQRSQVLKAVMDHIGVKLKIEEDPDHSGGPYIEHPRDYFNQLIFKTDRYLEVLDKLPLGRPVPTRISSRYGYRKDPLTGKKGFHSGIDFRGNRGDKVFATAAGTVKKIGNDRGYGRFIVIKHGNGYTTMFAHLHKILVKKGEKIKRGQLIGQVGNTGRSTGSHLHYEICRWGKSIDPMKYIQLSNKIVLAAKK